MPFPESMLPDSEEIFINSDDDDDDDDEDLGAAGFERVEVPDDEAPFGGDSCTCTCHGPTPNSAHCIHCSLKVWHWNIYWYQRTSSSFIVWCKHFHFGMERVVVQCTSRRKG